MIKISSACIGCGKCVSSCPFGALSMAATQENKMGRKAQASSACTNCGACVKVCPVKALSLEDNASASAQKDFSSYKNVWVFAEINTSKAIPIVRPVVLELLTKARELASCLNQQVCAVIIGQDIAKYYEKLRSYGAQTIYSVEGPAYAQYNTAAYANAMINLIKKHKPSAVLFPSTYFGRDLAPRIAAEVYAGLTADCTALSVKDNLLVQTRPAFGGNIYADITTPATRPQMATVRPNVMVKEELPLPSRPQLNVLKEDILPPPEAQKVRIISRQINPPKEANKLKTAPFIAAGGRGMKSADNFAALNKLADILGGGVGASRAAIEAGWKPKDHQIGQSGLTVKPPVYLACGISGAVQHTVGMQDSDYIIALNKDAAAAIFNFADLGIVCDGPSTVKKLLELIENKDKGVS